MNSYPDSNPDSYPESYHESNPDSESDSETEIETILDEIIQRVSVNTDPELTDAMIPDAMIPDTMIPDLSISVDKIDSSHMSSDEESDVKLCVICLDDTNACVKNIKDLKHIDKICDCDYDVHIKCFHRWIQTTPACPYCHELILIKNRTRPGQYQQIRTLNNTAVRSSTGSAVPGAVESYQNYYVEPTMCMRLCKCIYLYRGGIYTTFLIAFMVFLYCDSYYF